MSYAVVCAVALLASGLTLFSGFGLGTLLLPAFALFFPVEIAISATAVVHLANNLFKLFLVGRHARARVVLAFGLPALLGAVAGAVALTGLAGLPTLAEYTLRGRVFPVTTVKLVVGGLILVFALVELLHRPERTSSKPPRLLAGGLLAGFFGGLSGHQGALRSAFLIRTGLSKEAFIGTGVTCAVLVDLARLAVYGAEFLRDPLRGAGWEGHGWGLVLAATAAAFAGAFLGVRLMGRITLAAVRNLIGGLLVLLGLALAAGLI